MRSNSMALATVIALFFNAIGIGLTPLTAAAAPIPDRNPASSGTLPARPATIPARPYQVTDPETYTDGTGSYRFADLPHGTHKVTLDLATLPPGLRPAEEEPAPILWLTPGVERTSDLLSTGVRFTAAYAPEGSTIAGLVFLDRDRNGWPDPGEPGLPGVRVIDPTVHQYFVPFNDTHLWTLFDDKDTGLPGAQRCHRDGVPVAGTLNSSIFLIASSDGSVFYYDHWEDGYDADPLVPGITTEAGVLDAGAFRVFHSDIDPAEVGTPGVLLYDGRDRITVVGEEASVVRQVFPSTPGTVLAAAWEVSEVADWGTYFVATVGEDLDFNGAAIVDDHDFAGLEVMAAVPGTAVYYNGNLETTLDAGETYFVDGANNGVNPGGVSSADTITATAPIQVQMLTGACGLRYSANGYTMQPVEMWDDAYWAPVPGFAPRCGPSRLNTNTDIYLHNLHAYPINVTVSSGLNTANVVIPPNSTISVLDATGWPDLATGYQATYLSASETFWGVSVIDSSTNGGVENESQIFDWGYSLVSESELSSQAIIGYAPGNRLETDNGNLAFITAVTDTVLYVDLTQDGLPDPVDLNGDGDRDDLNVSGVGAWDEPFSALGIPLGARQILRVGDPDDHNLMGALIYTLNLEEKIAVAWGQDACVAQRGDPYLDLGYTVLPVSIPRLSKTDALAIDADLTGGVSPGDTVMYTLVFKNNGTGPMDNVVLTDNLPYTHTNFVPGSLQATTPPPLRTVEYYDGASWGTLPITYAQRVRVSWDTIGPGQPVTVTFRVQLHTDMPVTVKEISNQAVVESSETKPRLSEDPDDPTDPDTDTPVERPLLAIDKNVSPTVVQPGDLITYTLVISNYGDGVALLTAITDTLPAWFTYVPHTLDLTWPTARVVTVPRPGITETTYFHAYYADDFDLTVTQTTNYAGNDGTATWSGDWSEVNDNIPSNPGIGEVQVRTDGLALSAPGYLWMTNTDGRDAGAVRRLNLSQYRAPRLRYYFAGNTNEPNDRYRVQVSGLPDIEAQYTGAYTVAELDISAAAGNPDATLGFLATSGLEIGEHYRFDHISVYETDLARVRVVTLTYESLVLTYTTSTDGDPFSYYADTGQMVITRGLRLPAGGVVTATFQARVTTPLADGLTPGNTACTTATNWLEILSPPCDSASVQVRASHALTITKSATPSPVAMGGLLTYTLHYTITGNEAVESMVVSDTTPVNTTFAAATPEPIVEPLPRTRGPVIWRVGGLWPPGSGITQATGTLAMGVWVERGLISGTLIYNTVLISDTTGMTDTDEITTPVRPPTPGLELVKTVVPSQVTHDMPFTYALRIINTGDIPFFALRLTDTLPPGFDYIDGSGRPTDPDAPIVEPNLVWSNLLPTGGRLEPGASLTVTFQVETSLTSGTYTNTATVEGTYEGGTLTDSDDAPVSVVNPEVTVEKLLVAQDTDPDPPNYVTLTISIANVGSSNIARLPLRDQYDTDYLEFESATPYPEEAINDGLLTWYDLTAAGPHGFGRDLLLGETFVITTVFKMVNTGVTSNTAIVTGAEDENGYLADEVEDDEPIAATPLQLLYFRAVAEEADVRLEWATAAEVNIVGFGVYRALDTRLSDAQPIAYLPATGPGSIYSHVDRDVAPGQVYWYWLAEVNVYGTEATHGPVWGGIGPQVLPYRFYLPLVNKRWGE